ncbi:MAG: HNH endonuclease [Xanthobacteraceae bacterium]
MKEKSCECCGKMFGPSPGHYGARWAAARFCSRACGYAFRRPTPEQFWARVDKRGPDDCWPWTGEVFSAHGYGQVWFEGASRRAHRVAFRLTHGYYPPYSRHSCDNYPCCNPEHLLEGTHLDNMRDKVERGRQPRGSKAAHAKLTEADIIAIRADPRPQAEIAKVHGIDGGRVSRIRTRKIWRHVP